MHGDAEVHLESSDSRHTTGSLSFLEAVLRSASCLELLALSCQDTWYLLESRLRIQHGDRSEAVEREEPGPVTV